MLWEILLILSGASTIIGFISFFINTQKFSISAKIIVFVVSIFIAVLSYNTKAQNVDMPDNSSVAGVSADTQNDDNSSTDEHPLGEGTSDGGSSDGDTSGGGTSSGGTSGGGTSGGGTPDEVTPGGGASGGGASSVDSLNESATGTIDDETANDGENLNKKPVNENEFNRQKNDFYTSGYYGLYYERADLSNIFDWDDEYINVLWNSYKVGRVDSPYQCLLTVHVEALHPDWMVAVSGESNHNGYVAVDFGHNVNNNFAKFYFSSGTYDIWIHLINDHYVDIPDDQIKKAQIIIKDSDETLEVTLDSDDYF